MDEQIAWRRLSSANEKLANNALANLQERYIPALHAYLRNAGMANRADCEDLINRGFLKLWTVRERINCESEAAGRSYLFTIVRRCMIDDIRAHAKAQAVPVDTFVGTPLEPTARDAPDSEAYARIMSAQVLTAANCLWLGLDSTLLPETHTRQLLAAKYYYLDNFPLNEIVDMIKPPRPLSEPRLTISTLESWINHAGVLRYLAFDQLCYESLQLLMAVLELDDATPQTISDLWDSARTSAPDGPGIANLTWAAVAIAIIRYHHCVSFDIVAGARHDLVQRWGYSSAKLLGLLEFLCRRLPFCQNTEMLLELIEYHDELQEGNRPARILGAPNLWQRLTFQYCYVMDLTQRDILERVQPSAQIAGYALAESTLNSWTSGKRLHKRFLQYWKELYGDVDGDLNDD